MGRPSRPIRRRRSRITVAASSPASRRPMRYAVALPITVVRPCIVFGAGDRGMVEVFRPIARSGLHVVGGPGERRVSLVAAADLAACLVLAAERGERLAPGVPGQGVYFAAAEDVSYVELGIAIARALAKPRPRTVSLPGWSVRTIGRIGDRRVADSGAPGVDRQRQGPRGTRRLVDLLVGEGPAAAGLAAGGRARRPAPRNRAVVPRRALALSEPPRCRSRRRPGQVRRSPGGCRAVTAPGRRCDRSWRASFPAAGASRANFRCSRAPTKIPSP